MLNPRLVDMTMSKLATDMQKQAFVPPPPAGGGMPPGMPMDPAMAGGGMPPGMPMDPAMMGGGMPMDPAMAGMDPAAMGAMPGAGGGEMAQVSLDDLRQLFQEVAGDKKSGGDGEGKESGSEIDQRFVDLEEAVAGIAGALGIGGGPQAGAGMPEDPAAMGMGAGPEAGGMPPGMPPGMPMDPAMAGGGMPMGGGMPGMEVQASAKKSKASSITELLGGRK